MVHKNLINNASSVSFIIIIICSVALYTYHFSGALLQYDDPSYMYSIISQNIYLVYNPFAAGESGYFLFTLPFRLILGTSLFMPSIAQLSAIIITTYLIFRIGESYRKFAGVISAFFYAFSPLVVAYSTRFLPDPFIALFLILSIFIFLSASKRNSYLLYFLSGFACGFGILFGIQAPVSFLAYVSFILTYMVINRTDNKTKIILLVIIGMCIDLLIYTIPQAVIFGNPFYGFDNAFEFYTQFPTPTYENYYPYTIFPVSHIGTLPKVTNEPYSNAGILGFIFLVSLLSFFTRSRRFILPYIIASLVFIIYLQFGSQNVYYQPIQGINRLLIPVIALVAIASGMFLASFKKSKIKSISIIIILVVYISTAFLIYQYAYNFYNRSDNIWLAYNITTTLSNIFNISSNSGYAVSGNITYLPTICYYLHTPLIDCNVTTGQLSPQYCINFNPSKAIIIVNRTLCGPNYSYKNSKFDYYIYIVRNGSIINSTYRN